MTLGYEKPLLILPFDHRATFKEKLFGFKGKLTKNQKALVSKAKEIVFKAYLNAVANGLNKAESGILVDEEFGSNILEQCKKNSLVFALPVEKSGQEVFDFEYGKSFKKHILQFKPTFAKVLVRFNPDGNKASSQMQLKRLKVLSDFCQKSQVKLMFELLVIPTEAQIQKAGSKALFDKAMRPKLMVESMKRIQIFGIKVDVWKIEGLEKKQEMQAAVRQAKVQGKNVGVIVLGRGENEEKVKEWLSTAAKVKGVIGFAVGRTVFWDALVGFKENKITEKRAIRLISEKYLSFVKLWKREKK